MRMRRAVVKGLALAVLALGACSKTQGEGTGEAQAAGVGTVEQARQRLRELEKRYGEDAYDRPEAVALVRDLEALGSDSPERLQALELLDFLRAKQRLAYAARQGTPPQHQEVPNYGPVRMEGAAPSSPADLERVKKLKVGSKREELVAAYGSCLVRQTWFPGAKGNPTIELFHVGPDCRDRLEQKIYRVRAGAVDQIQEGNLDSAMPAEDDPERYVNSRPPPSEEEGVRQARERYQQQQQQSQ